MRFIYSTTDTVSSPEATLRLSATIESTPAPLVFTSAALMLLVVLGTLALLPWLLIALVPLGVVAARAARAWREIARLQGRGAATAAILGGFAARLRDALWNAREDIRDLLGILRPAAAPDAPAPSPAGIPPLASLRSVPSVREPGSIGSVPAPAEVATIARRT